MTTAESMISAQDAKAAFARTLAPLAEASTLPPMCYTSREFYDLEVERIFLKEWLNVGRVDEIPNPGDYYTLTLLGEPVVVCRDQDGDVQCMSTVCRHRAAEVVEGKGNRKRFQCPYHLWTYSLKGELVGAPLMDEARGFDKRKVCLPKLRVEVWEGFIFVNFDLTAAPLGPKLAPVSAALANYRLSELRSRILEERECPFNWKFMLDNFMEFYHVMGLHKGTHDLLGANCCSSCDRCLK